MLVSTCLAVLLAWMILFRYRRRRMYQLAALVPTSDDSLPGIGIAHNFIGNNEGIMRSMEKYSYVSIENNGIMQGWLGHILYFVLVNPVDVEIILKACLEKDDLHRFIRTVIGNGGIFAPVSIWRRRRKILMPAFSPKIVENFVEVFSEQSQILAKQLKAQTDTGQFSIWPFLTSYTLDSVMETAMGVKLNAQGNPDSPFLNSISRVLNIITQRIFHLWLQPDWLFKFFPKSHEQEICIKRMHSFTDEVIQNKRDELLKEKHCQAEADHQYYDIRNYQRKTFLDLLISLSGGEKGYSNVELREEVLTLTIAGTDTSAVAIGYTLMLLAKYPKIQEKVYEELRDVFGDSDRPLVKDDLLQLKYLERVVKESLRLFPPVPFIIRKVLEEIKLPSTGYTLPAGSGVVVSIWGIHRDPNYWGPDAEAFDPDRFLPERFDLKHACSFMPFSNGPRNCLGYQYALMSIKTALSAILRHYRVVGQEESSNIPRIRVKLDVMMKAVDGYQVALEKRSACTAK